MSSRWIPRITTPGNIGGPVPPSLVDRFAPKYLVGNVPAGDSAVAHNAGGFMYIPDPGDGTGIALALTQPNGPGDVWLRPGTYNFSVALLALPLLIPAGVRVFGAGRSLVTINSDTLAGSTQEVFTLGASAELIDVGVFSGVSAGPVAGSSKAVIRLSNGSRVERCLVTLAGAARTQLWGIWDPSGAAEVLGTFMVGENQTNAATPSIAIVVGPSASDSPNAYVADGSYRIVGCRTDAGTGKPAPAGFNKAVYTYNTGGGHISECDFRSMQRPQLGVIQFDYANTPFVFPAGPIADVLATVDDVRIEVAATEGSGQVADQPYAGVAITNKVTGVGLNLGVFEWTAIRVLFRPATGPNPPAPTVPRAGFFITAVATADADVEAIEGGLITGCAALGNFNEGVLLVADGGAGAGTARVTDIRIAGGVYKNAIAIGGGGDGIKLTTQSASPNSLVDAVGITNCDCKNAPATVTGINIGTAKVKNTIVVANNATPNGGTAYTDNGTLTQAGLNIFT